MSHSEHNGRKSKVKGEKKEMEAKNNLKKVQAVKKNLWDREKWRCCSGPKSWSCHITENLNK